MADETVATNREARHNYHILETFEAGIALQGAEVKSLRDKKANLKDSFARIDDDELFLYNMHISPYPQAGRFAPDPKRRRKLLMHKPQINKLQGDLAQKGLTLVPLKIYFKKGMAKAEIALVKGKKLYDRREDIKKRASDRDLRREVRGKG
ncbi:MAG: SsrA-binding protein SmpB [Candidatus Omnitrophica bacterium]|nr:SsrA-binding protein SmpB [Candidatus Omnitrophota bacterium]MDD5546864.1 SsrA-binding protein SmpB [Candidatus Omnitrophota bacterium]